MAISLFPLAFPVSKFAKCDVVPYRREAVAVAVSGRDPAVDRGAFGWTGSWDTNPGTAAEIGAWEAFNGALHGLQRTFLGWDTLHEYPLAYMPAGFGALTRWDGTAFDTTGVLGAVQTLKVARDGADLYDLPSGLVLSPGDHVSFQWADSPAMNYDFTGGANGWTASGGALSTSGGAQLLTPSSTSAKITSPTVTAFSGATFNRLYLDIETVSGPGTVAAIITLNGSVSFAASFRLPANGKRTRQLVDFSGNATWLATTAITSVSIQPVSTNAGSYRFWGMRLDNGLSESQRYQLTQVTNPTAVTADANGKAAGVWLNHELLSVVPVGALVRLWRAPAKFKRTKFSSAKSADGGPRPAIVSLQGISVPT